MTDKVFDDLHSTPIEDSTGEYADETCSAGSNYAENRLRAAVGSSSAADGSVNHNPFDLAPQMRADTGGMELHLAGGSTPEAISDDVSPWPVKLPVMTDWVSTSGRCRRRRCLRCATSCDAYLCAANSRW